MLELAIQVYQPDGNALEVAIAQSNLSLAYQALGRWQDAEDAIQSSLSTLRALNHPDILAQVLDVQGQLQFGRGEFEQALLTWEESASLYRALNQDSHTQSALVRNSHHASWDSSSVFGSLCRPSNASVQEVKIPVFLGQRMTSIGSFGKETQDLYWRSSEEIQDTTQVLIAA